MRLLVWGLLILSVVGQPTVSVNEVLSLDVVQCPPGRLCAEDGSVISSCPQGSEHLLLSGQGITEIAVCAMAGADHAEENKTIDLGLTIDLPLDSLTDDNFWNALDWDSLQASAVSYQEYLALDVSLCSKGFFCKEPNLSLPCASGSFGPSEGLSACFQCPSGMPSLEGSTHFQDCTGGMWIPLRVPDTILDDAAELQGQLAAFYGVPPEAVVWIS